MTNLLPYSGSKGVVTLGGAAGRMIKIEGDKNFGEHAWETTDRVVHDLELRARIVGGNIPIGGLGTAICPVVRMLIDYGHGDVAYTDPPAVVSADGLPQFGYTLPARGLAMRLSARNVNVRFTLDGVAVITDGLYVAPGAAPEKYTLSIAVSIQPASSAHPAGFPRQQLALTSGDKLQPIPMGAHEFCVYDCAGNPFEIGLEPEVFARGLFGGVVGRPNWLHAYATSGYADAWLRIPHDAAALLLTTSCYLGFR